VSGAMKIVVGIIAIAISFIVFPVALDGVQVVLSDANLADYTGLEAVAQVTPLLIWVSMLFTGGLLTFQGMKSTSAGRRKGSR